MLKNIRSALLWRKSAKVPDVEIRGFKLIYGWADPSVRALLSCSYIYVFKVSKSEPWISNGLRRGRITRRFVFAQLFGENTYRRIDDPNKSAADDWDEIIPSQNRHPTHRIEIGILRKGSGIPRSPFFSEYFCFHMPHKASDRIAIQIAGFVADQLSEFKVFEGEAIDGNKLYWLMCVHAAWKRYKQ